MRFVFIVATLALLACSSSTTAEANVSDPSCPTGMTTLSVDINDSSFNNGSIYVEIVRPNDGCNLPAMVCYLSDISYGGGISCSPLEPGN